MKTAFLVDEDLPRSLAPRLRAEGFHVVDVRDVGLRGRPDDEVASYAKTQNLVVLSADLDFGNILRYPMGSHPGIAIVRFPNEIPTDQLNDALTNALRGVAPEELQGNVLIIEPSRVRLRKG